MAPLADGEGCERSGALSNRDMTETCECGRSCDVDGSFLVWVATAVAIVDAKQSLFMVTWPTLMALSMCWNHDRKRIPLSRILSERVLAHRQSRWGHRCRRS